MRREYTYHRNVITSVVADYRRIYNLVDLGSTLRVWAAECHLPIEVSSSYTVTGVYVLYSYQFTKDFDYKVKQLEIAPSEGLY